MKKNLTLLMMLAAFVGILSAQSGPKFNYQAVVRNADTLVYNQDMDVVIGITETTNPNDTLYSEKHRVTSSPNGLVSILIGQGTSAQGNLANIDWSKAVVNAKFTYNDTINLTVTTPVTPVPYAIYAGSSLLTTEMIANYMRNVLTTQDAEDILNALVLYNDDLQQDLEDTIEIYLKAHKEIAVDVAKAYLSHLTAANVQEVHDAIESNPEGRDAVKEKVKDFIISQRELAKELTIWYLQTATTNDIERAYATFQQIPTATKNACKELVIDYFRHNDAPIASLVTYLIDNVSAQEIAGAYYYFENLNSNDVNGQLRDTLDRFIGMYLNTHSNTTDAAAVEDAIDQYLANHHVVGICSGVTVCEIDSLYKVYRQNGGGNNNNNNNYCTTCPQYVDISYSQEQTGGYRLSAEIDLSCGYVGQHFIVTYNGGEGQTEVDATYDANDGVFSGVVTPSDFGMNNFATVSTIEFKPAVHVNCGSANGADLEGSEMRIDLR